MIDTLFFVLQIVGIVTLLGWAVLHDRLAEGSDTVGPLAFKQHDEHNAGGKRSPRSRTSVGNAVKAVPDPGKRRRSIKST